MDEHMKAFDQAVVNQQSHRALRHLQVIIRDMQTQIDDLRKDFKQRESLAPRKTTKKKTTVKAASEDE